jgi:chromosome segregation protein
VITRDGEWLGANWIRVNRGTDHHAGVLAREHQLKTLRSACQDQDSKANDIAAHLHSVRLTLSEAEAQRDELQTAIQSAHRGHSELLGQLEAMRARAQESSLRIERLKEEALDANRETAATQAGLTAAREALQSGIARLEELDTRKPVIETEREERRETLQAARGSAQTEQLAARDLLVRSESRRSAEAAAVASLTRMSEQSTQLSARCTQLEQELSGGDMPIVELENRLHDALARRLEVETSLGEARRSLEAAELELRTLEEKRYAAEQRVTEARTAMEEARLAAQESRVRREALLEQFAETQFVLDEIMAGLKEEAAVLLWEQQLAAVRQDIDKLGQVNLAAIDELREHTERKEYLDRQFADLTSALDTLEEAMKRIDKETRSRFDDTFERINNGLKEKFPRLFGGGHAYLELTGDDPLAAGVAVMARPPGKRNSSIHQLSGGEKALTAVALVFSIFDLNPAPFCLLDEVDAPLDEHNVGRFCDIVREMSKRVQFIFITHNKTTMELAAQLLGVTMHEPGVSRLVAVDVDEAVRLAAV